MKIPNSRIPRLRFLTLLIAIACFSTLASNSFSEDLKEENIFLDSTALPDQSLRTYRGKEGGTVILFKNEQDLSATVNDTTFSADKITTGSISMDRNAFETFSGIGQFTFITGNANAVDTAIGITVNLQ